MFLPTSSPNDIFRNILCDERLDTLVYACGFICVSSEPGDGECCGSDVG